MRSPQTLFVIGAGASREVDMPTGRQLIDIIAKKLDYQFVNGSRRQGCGDDDILDIFQQHTQTREGIEFLFSGSMARARWDYLFQIDRRVHGHP